MTEHESTPFAGQPSKRYAILALLLASIVGVPCVIPSWTTTTILVVGWIEMVVVTCLFAVLAPTRFRWTARLVAAVISVGIAPILVLMAWQRGLPHSLTEGMDLVADLSQLGGAFVVTSVYALFGRDVRPAKLANDAAGPSAPP